MNSRSSWWRDLFRFKLHQLRPPMMQLNLSPWTGLALLPKIKRYLFIYRHWACACDNRNGIHSLQYIRFTNFFSFSCEYSTYLDYVLCSIVRFALFSWIKSRLFSCGVAAADCRPYFRKKNKTKEERSRQGREARAVEIYQKSLCPVHVVISHLIHL